MSTLGMEALKRKRSAQAGNITRVLNKCITSLTDDLSELDLGLGHLEHQMAAIKTADATYREIHQTISDDFADKVNFDDEASVLEHHEDAVERILSLLNRLIAIYNVHSTATELHQRLATLEKKMEDSPDKIYPSLVTRLQED